MTHVAINLRTRRLAAGLSQKELAARSGISLRMIGAIEAGASSASTATLDRIGIALNATLADLVRDPAAPRTQAVDRLGWSGPHGGEGVLRWSVEARREVEVWEWRLQPGERYEAAADPQGWRVLLFVTEGRLTLEIGSESIAIERDPYLLDSARAHAFANRGEGVLRFFRCTCW
ncbi:helix-turn-helix domain-containing protein [Dokdonella ginsengisoli]|uniref:Helix-turn-helix domain-containing protein n=1 Tax=Dokdonella ginsengisoli TaxID=363846 RepID=A0ABV9QRQ3_9GAMM